MSSVESSTTITPAPTTTTAETPPTSNSKNLFSKEQYEEFNKVLTNRNEQFEKKLNNKLDELVSKFTLSASPEKQEIPVDYQKMVDAKFDEMRKELAAKDVENRMEKLKASAYNQYVKAGIDPELIDDVYKLQSENFIADEKLGFRFKDSEGVLIPLEQHIRDWASTPKGMRYKAPLDVNGTGTKTSKQVKPGTKSRSSSPTPQGVKLPDGRYVNKDNFGDIMRGK